MSQLLNTLFVTNQGTYLHLENDTVRVELERETKLKVPLLHLGSILLRDDARKAMIAAYQNRKQEEVTHQLLGRRIAVGLIPYIQARLLARHLRGDLEQYPPFLSK